MKTWRGWTLVAARPVTVATVAVVALFASCREMRVTAVDVSIVRIAAPTTELMVGQSARFGVRVEDVAGRELRREVAWASDAPAVATVDTEGLVTARSPGTARITATAGGRTGEVPVTVVLPAVATVGIVPSSTTLFVGDSVQLGVEVKAADGTTLTGRTVGWSTSDASVAGVTAGGLVHALSAGSATIIASVEGVRGQASVSVGERPLPVANVRVEPPSARLAEGDSIRLQAIATASDGSVISGRAVSWTTSSGLVAEVDATGRVRAVSPGTATVTATVDGVSGTAAITVTSVGLATMTVSPSSITMGLGDVARLEATVLASDGSVVTGLHIDWTSDMPAIASVDTAGAVTANGIGAAVITASTGGLSATANIFVVRQPIASLTISPAAPTLFAGDSVLVDAGPRDSNGTPLANRFVVWTTADPTIALAVSTGAATQQAWLYGLAAGTTTLTATAEGRTDQTTVTVVPRANLQVSKTASAPAVSAGDTVVYTITVTNLGPSEAAAVTVADTLPAASVFVDASAGAVLSGGTVTWSKGDIAAGGSTTETVRVLAPAAGSMTNVATASSPTSDPDPLDNIASTVTTVATVDLNVVVTGPAAVTVGSTITYTITVGNDGPGRALDVKLQNQLPANAAFVSATPAGYTLNNLVLEWSEPSLHPDSALVYTVTVDAQSVGTVQNSASVITSSVDTNPANDVHALSTTVNPAPADVPFAMSVASTGVVGHAITIAPRALVVPPVEPAQARAGAVAGAMNAKSVPGPDPGATDERSRP